MVAAASVFLLPLLCWPALVAAQGMSTSGQQLISGSGTPVILRGINYPFCWYTHRTDHAEQFAAMAAMGANSVRIVLCSGGQWQRTSAQQLEMVLGLCEENNMVAVVETHDSTGFGESGGAVHPDEAVDFWVSMRDVLAGHEDDVIVNIANEPFGNQNTEEWGPFHTGAVATLRTQGLKHVLMVDAPNWGQDWSEMMMKGQEAKTIAAADPQGAVVFSVHMYEVYSNAQIVNDYISSFSGLGLPLVIGEFADDHGPGKNVAEEAIFAANIGWMAWSWSGNSADLSSLDIVRDFNVAALSPWGEKLKSALAGSVENTTPPKVPPSDDVEVPKIDQNTTAVPQPEDGEVDGEATEPVEEEPTPPTTPPTNPPTTPPTPPPTTPPTTPPTMRPTTSPTTPPISPPTTPPTTPRPQPAVPPPVVVEEEEPKGDDSGSGGSALSLWLQYFLSLRN